MAARLINARTQQMGSVKGLAERDTESEDRREGVTANGGNRTREEKMARPRASHFKIKKNGWFEKQQVQEGGGER